MLDKELVAMDHCHCELIRSVVLSAKPNSVLEIGYGSGRCSRAIIDAIDYNGIGNLTVVDNWYDWGGVMPNDTLTHSRLTYITQSEESYVRSCSVQYDILVSDADHERSHLWADSTLTLLSDNGIAFFHDVTNPDYPNLELIEKACNDAGFSTIVFNTSSRPHERCQRGILMAIRK